MKEQHYILTLINELLSLLSVVKK